MTAARAPASNRTLPRLAHSFSSRPIAALAAALLSGAAGSVLAQTVPQGSPSERPKIGYEPIGGRVGSFMLYPTAEARIEYDDNPLALPAETSDDAVVTLRGGVEVRSLWQRHRLRGTAYVEQTLHARWQRENALEAGARVDGTYDISRDLAVRGHLAADLLAEDRSSITNVEAAREPTRFGRIDAQLTADWDLRPLRLTGEVQVLRLDFHDARNAAGAVLDQDFRDAVYKRAALTAAWEISPRVFALARGEVDRFTYVQARDPSNPLDRDSTGVTIEGGVRIELSRLMRAEARAGMLRRKSDDPALPGINGLAFGADVAWDVTPLTTVRLSADRQIEEGGSLLTSGNLRSQVRLRVEHELLRNLILESELRAARIRTIGLLDAEADERAAEFGATYYANRRLRLLASLLWFDRSSDTPFFRSFQRKRATVGVRIAF